MKNLSRKIYEICYLATCELFLPHKQNTIMHFSSFGKSESSNESQFQRRKKKNEAKLVGILNSCI